VKVAVDVCFACLPIVIAESMYSSFALPCVEVNEAGNPGRLIRKLKGMLRTRVA